ncbi:MAG: hypothetical protein JWL73_2852 [Actinomycetia bacterium]|nr:hypothetical protein [Actinomycetes bacterium]
MTADTAIILLAPGGAGLGAATVDEASRLRDALGAEVAVTTAEILDDAPDMGAVWVDVIEIHGALDGLEAAVAGMADRLGGRVDAAGSAVVVGGDRIIFEKDLSTDLEPVKLFYALFRDPAHEAERFSKLWYEGHVEYVKESPYVIHYHQLHADSVTTARVSALAGFGITDVAGVAHELFSNRDHFVTALEDEDLDDERADVGEFTDMARNRGILTRIRS